MLILVWYSGEVCPTRPSLGVIWAGRSAQSHAFTHADVCREIAWLCTNLTHLLDPDVIVFGGSAGRALKGHLELIGAEFRRWVLPGTPLPRLAIAEMDHAPTLGAALLFKQLSMTASERY